MPGNTVLVADDDQGVLDLLHQLLGRQGYKILLAANGEEAVEIAQDNPIDVALLDWKMPLMDGIETLGKIKAIDPYIEVLIMTGYADIESLDRILEHGASDYIVKPFNQVEITRGVRNALLKREFAGERDRLKKELKQRIAELEREYEERTRQLRESQIKYKQIIESSNDAIVVVQDGTLKFVNPKMTALTGYTQEEIQQMPFSALIHPEDHVTKRGRHATGLNTGEFPATYTFRALRKDGEAIWVEINAIRSIWEDRPATLEFIRDITDRKRAEEELQQSMATLQKALGGTIQAMALMVETRDPYTAGHQRRVADLARAIAVEMGLSEHQVDTIRVAGAIHDIGKIAVPGEILSKPGRITDIEFELIKMHPQVGYDILKNIEFPWPIAQTVLQHHERMNGSGYPQGLSGKEIILEARIVAVTDMIEAMASHRPYRPALGMDRALEEISGSRGVLLDPDVVEACLEVITKKGFAFEQPTMNPMSPPR